jgi:hypothetical protein
MRKREANPKQRTTKMALHQKRNTYIAQLDNAESIGANQTIVPILVKNITEAKTVKGTVYYRISAICMSTGDTFVKVKVKKVDDNKKTKVEDIKKEEACEDSVPAGTVIRAGEQFMATTYDRSCGGVEQGTIAKLAITTDWYNDHYTFQASKVIVDENNSDVLTRSAYDSNVVGTSLAHIPTKNNFSSDDFPDGTDEKYINRSFIVPLSMGTGESLFSNVEIQVDPHDKGRFFTSRRDDPVQYLGVNFDTGGDKPYNMLKVVYTLNDKQESKILMTYAYMPDIWECFGITNLEQWKNIAGRMIFYAVDWLVYGYSQHSKIMSIMANMDDDGGNDDNFEYSTGFITKMGMDVGNTVRGCGIPLSYNYMVSKFGVDSTYENDNEVNNPLNNNWKVLLKRNKPFVLNITDFTSDQMNIFLKEYSKLETKHNIKFYGIYSIDSDAPYEIMEETDIAREVKMSESGIVPTVIFAVNTK